MHTYYIILISIPNVPILKFKYQIMFDHYADHRLFYHCTNHHLPHHYANIIQLLLFVILKSKETIMHNSDTLM